MKVSEEKPLSIRVLGLPEVSFEGRRLRFGRKKVLALLCYLATEGRKRSRREPVTVRAAKGYACSPSMVTSLG
jgi:hypothetical protein